jgi:hypothetical protein
MVTQAAEYRNSNVGVVKEILLLGCDAVWAL